MDVAQKYMCVCVCVCMYVCVYMCVYIYMLIIKHIYFIVYYTNVCVYIYIMDICTHMQMGLYLERGSQCWSPFFKLLELFPRIYR